MMTNDPPPDTPWVLLLSGGGFRAALFHLGVIRYLNEAGKLKQIRHIYAVSGGSILAAHLVLNWKWYTGPIKDFDDQARKIIAFAQKDMRGQVIRRWLWAALWVWPRLCWGEYFTRTQLLEKQYEELYGGARLRDLKKGGDSNQVVPDLHILAASMTTLRLCSFNREGFWIEPRGNPDARDTPDHFPATDYSVARAVAASSAFPPVFPPVRVTYRDLGCAQAKLPQPELLTDGGVFDNLGLFKLHRQLSRAPENPSVVFVSDAQPYADWEVENRFGFILNRVTRTTDVMMSRITDSEYLAMDGKCQAVNTRLIRCQIAKDKNAGQLPYLTTLIRTDLNRFSEQEVNALVMQGQYEARNAMASLTPAEDTPLSGQPWLPFPNAAPTPDSLSDSQRLRLSLWGRPRRFSIGILSAFVLWTALAMGGVALLVYVVMLAGSAVQGWLSDSNSNGSLLTMVPTMLPKEVLDQEAEIVLADDPLLLKLAPPLWLHGNVGPGERFVKATTKRLGDYTSNRPVADSIIQLEVKPERIETVKWTAYRVHTAPADNQLFECVKNNGMAKVPARSTVDDYILILAIIRDPDEKEPVRLRLIRK